MAQYPKAYFFYPPTNNTSPFLPAATYRLGDSLDVSWTSDFPNGGIKVVLFCGKEQSDVPSALGEPLSASPTAPLNNPFQFALNQDYNGPQGVCHFHLTTDPYKVNYGNNSGTFIVINDSGLEPVTWAFTNTTTSTLSQSTPAISTSTPAMSTVTMSITVMASSTPASDNTTKAPSSPPPNSGTETGVAVGVTCGVLGFAILLGLLFWKRRQNKTQDAGVTGQLKDTHQRLSQQEQQLSGSEVRAELAASSTSYELDGVPVAEGE